MSDLAHGEVGKHELNFTELLTLRTSGFSVPALVQLAQDMKGAVDTVKDGPDPEENILVPAGYTYFGQFIDHDLTFDSASTLDGNTGAAAFSVRTPRFDLDCLYGDGPDAQPFMYDGAKLLFKDGPPTSGPGELAARDLLRNPNGRAIIGDKRNDENSIVSQIQLGFVRYHNAVVDTLRTQDPNDWNTPNKLFESARNEVRWAYQKLVVEDFLPRIVPSEVFQDLAGETPATRDSKYVLYSNSKRGNLPREFVAAAYRFGHSGVRTGYRMNKHADNRFSIFPASGDPTPKAGAESLLGFDPITNNQVIDDWGRFFPATLPGVLPTEDRNHAAGTAKHGAVRLQFAYKLDPTLVDPLGVLPRRQVAGEGTTQQATTAIAPTQLPDKVGEPPRPSLALLNLLRGNTYRIQGGQAVAAALKAGGLPVTPLDPSFLVTRQPGSVDKKFIFKPIPTELQADTPLWFYILAEAQAPLVAHFGVGEFDEKGMLHGIGAKTQLGWVGGRIVTEVFYGLLDADSESFVNAAPVGWKPMFKDDMTPIVVRSLLEFADSVGA